MYRKILVPLDGSKLAESVLPHVESVVKGCSSPEVVFVRVVEPVQIPVGAAADGSVVYNKADATRDKKKIDSLNIESAKEYLNELVQKAGYGNAQVSSVVLSGDVAKSLADYADKNSVDLIIISTHGRSGISRMVWGSIADKIMRNTCVPVFMVRAPGCGPNL
jgi:nucleotide-binding universal stress UspA family protein